MTEHWECSGNVQGIQNLGISHFTSEKHQIVYHGQENHRRYGVNININKKRTKSILRCSTLSNRMSPREGNQNTEQTEMKQFYGKLPHLANTGTSKRMPD